MKDVHQITNVLSWKDLIPKIEPKPYALLLQDEQNFTLGWDIKKEVCLSNSFDIKEVDDFIAENKGQHIFVQIGYETKDQIESCLSSNNKKLANFPDVHLFTTSQLIKIENGIQTFFGDSSVLDFPEKNPTNSGDQDTVILEALTSKSEYLHRLNKIKEHIQRGDIYEMNYCTSFIAEGDNIDHFLTFCKLNEIAHAPFSTLISTRFGQIMSASPERFIRKEGTTLISQPIKGTSKRGGNEAEDNRLKKELEENQKERAENIMIVDLVRNDLSKLATKNSVEVTELCEPYTFNTVHQLISTIECELKDNVLFSDILQALFPMGSMTGAPKISAMQIIEKYEDFARGMYSGSIGIIKPNGDFDLNVVIRSLIRCNQTKLISASVGGAITIKSDPEKEYQECLTKLEALKKALC